MATPRSRLDGEKVIRVMKELTLWNIRVSDATRFGGNIPLKKQDYVQGFAKTLKAGSSPSIGAGSAGPRKEYSLQSITEGTKQILQTQRGVCHNFAQLAFAQLLVSMREDPPKLPLCNIKIIANSIHTLVLLGYEDSNCSDEKLEAAYREKKDLLLVDPWLAAMGNDESAGIYKPNKFTYRPLLGSFECVYNCNPAEVKREEVTKLAGILSRGLSQLERRPEYKKEEKKAEHKGTSPPLRSPSRRPPSSPSLTVRPSLSGSLSPPERSSPLSALDGSSFSPDLGSPRSLPPSPGRSLSLSPSGPSPSHSSSARLYTVVGGHGVGDSPRAVETSSSLPPLTPRTPGSALSTSSSSRAVSNAVGLICKKWEQSSDKKKLDAFVLVVATDPVVAMLQTLAKTIPDPAKLCEKVTELFEKGIMASAKFTLRTQGFSESDIRVIEPGVTAFQSECVRQDGLSPHPFSSSVRSFR